MSPQYLWFASYTDYDEHSIIGPFERAVDAYKACGMLDAQGNPVEPTKQGKLWDVEPWPVWKTFEDYDAQFNGSGLPHEEIDELSRAMYAQIYRIPLLLSRIKAGKNITKEQRKFLTKWGVDAT